ncbi:MAG: sensor domain-containing diguanylate cyclase, partial [Cycloclasticus sp.]
KALPLTPPQVKALGELYNLTTANSINQHKVINLLIEDDKDTASTLLFEQAIPNQVPMRAIVSDIITMVENENARITGGLQIDIKSKQQISFALTLMLGLFAVILISLLLKGIKIGDVLLTHKTTVHDSLISSAIDAIVVMNDDGVITAFNKGASLLFGYKEADIINKNINTLLTISFNHLVTLGANAKQGGEDTNAYIEDDAIHKDSYLIPVQLAMTDTGVFGDHRFNLIIRDLSQRKESERRLIEQTHELEEARARYKKLSETDPLTKIANRRAYEERLIDEINTAKRSTKPLALIMLDVDSFKQYNDYYGHDLGDVVLKRIAQVISESLPRSTDFSGRFGGEEFVVLLPSTDIFGAYQVAEKIRLSIKSLEIKHIKSDVKHVITVSAGIAALSGDSLNDIELFKQADTALYQAKEAGRNKSITFKLSNKDNRSNKL